MVREENNFLKAEIVGLQKQLDELGTKVKEEREGLQKKFEEERNEMHKLVQAKREASQKRSRKKKVRRPKEESKDTGTPKSRKTHRLQETASPTVEGAKTRRTYRPEQG